MSIDVECSTAVGLIGHWSGEFGIYMYHWQSLIDPIRSEDGRERGLA